MTKKRPMTTTEVSAEFFALAVLIERVSNRLGALLREQDHTTPDELRRVLSSEVNMLDTIRERCVEGAHEVTA